MSNNLTYDYPADFAKRLVRFKEESKLSWVELNRRLGTYPHTLTRWKDKGVLIAVVALAALVLTGCEPLGHVPSSGVRVRHPVDVV